MEIAAPVRKRGFYLAAIAAIVVLGLNFFGLREASFGFLLITGALAVAAAFYFTSLKFK